MAKLEGITPERDEKSLEAAYALTQAVADVSLGDVWSEIRRACARGVARVPLDGPRRARLAAVFGPAPRGRGGADGKRPPDGGADAGQGRRRRRGPARRRGAPRAAARASALESGGLVDVGRLAGLLAHDASTVRQAASVCLQRVGAKSEGLGDVALGAIDVARRPDDWRWTEGALMAYDGVLSDEASAATARLGDDAGPSAAFLERLLRGAWDWLLATLGEEGSFEVRRAARQLAFSAARADFAFDALGPPGAGGLGFLVDPAVPPSHRALGARLLAHGVSFGRFCDEALADAECTPLFRKWGLSHEGAGGDSEAVSKAEAAVRDAARARPAALRSRVGALRLAVLGGAAARFRRPGGGAREHLPEAAAPPKEPQEARLLLAARGQRSRRGAAAAGLARGARRRGARGDRDDARAASRRFVVDALAVLLRAALGRVRAGPPPEPLAACADRALGGLFRAVSFRGAADDLSPRKRKAGVARAVVADVPPGARAAAERGEAATAAAFVARSLADRLVGAKGRKDADLSARLLGALALAALLSACDGSSDAFCDGGGRRVGAPSAEDPPDDWDDWDDDDDAPDCGGGDEDDDALDAERALTAAIDAEAAKDGRRPPFYSSFEPGAATSAGVPLLPSLAFF
ncbi:hypothetical protein JL722_6560 [Aureococcus anophagefferens]|nr:hypothetical protein JL722_6560 [Aureococcus anophagefferens]